MKYLYCVNLFRGEVLEGQVYVSASDTEEARHLVLEKFSKLDGLELIPVRIESDKNHVYHVGTRKEAESEFKNPRYCDGHITIDEYNVEVIRFKNGKEIVCYDTIRSNDDILVASEAIDLYISLIKDGDLTKEDDVIITIENQRTKKQSVIDAFADKSKR